MQTIDAKLSLSIYAIKTTKKWRREGSLAHWHHWDKVIMINLCFFFTLYEEFCIFH